MVRYSKSKSKSRKSKKAKSKKAKSKKTRRQRGGSQDTWQIPSHAVVISRNLQDDEDSPPVVSTYEDVRASLNLEPVESIEKLNTVLPENVYREEDAEYARGEGLQVEQEQPGVEGGSSRNRRRSASRKGY